VRVDGGKGSTVGYVKLVGAGALTGLLVLTAVGCELLASGSVTPMVGSPGEILVSGSETSAATGRSTIGVAVGPERTVVSGSVNANHLTGPGSFMQLPFAESFMSASGQRAPRVVLVSYSEQFDSRYYPQRLRTVRSVDGGKTFTPLASDVPINSMTQLADGSLVAVDFRTTSPTPTTARPGQGQRTTSAQPPGAGSKQFTTTFWRSHDSGATWVQRGGTISAGDAYDALFFHRGILAGRDGSLLAPTHGYLHGEAKYRSMLARSTDGGATWRIVSTIAKSPPGWRIEGRSEPTMARATNGDLVVVMRQSAPVNPNVCNGSRQGSGLVISRSSNDGASWTPAGSLVGAGLDDRNVSSADPHLVRMPGGQLILSYGRPGNKILVSKDGNGATWGDLTLTRAGISSGYTSLVALTKTTALQVGDNGSNWCFRAASGPHRVAIWAKTIVFRPYVAARTPIPVGVAAADAGDVLGMLPELPDTTQGPPGWDRSLLSGGPRSPL
jgi:BNR repeat-like domain